MKAPNFVRNHPFISLTVFAITTLTAGSVVNTSLYPEQYVKTPAAITENTPEYAAATRVLANIKAQKATGQSLLTSSEKRQIAQYCYDTYESKAAMSECLDRVGTAYIVEKYK
jgi:hypothetical protein